MKKIDFNNTEIGFRSKTDRELYKNLELFNLMDKLPLDRIGSHLPQWFLRSSFGRNLIRRTMFDQFVGGETLDEVDLVVQKLHQWGVDVILDYGVESTENELEFERTLEQILASLHYKFSSKSVKWITIKLSALFPNKKLVQMSSLLNQNIFRISKTVQSQIEDDMFQRCFERLEKICNACKQNNIGLMIDAEESWIQDAIDWMALQLIEQYNKSQKVIVVNTFQLYRKDRLRLLKQFLSYTKRKKIQLGAKLVRGAYVEKEAKYATLHHKENPVFSTKESTDQSFNAGMMLCLENITDVLPIIATHNEIDTKNAVELISTQFKTTHKNKVLFSQLYGMGEHLTFNLAHHSFKVAKYVPYGNVLVVFQYLIRRAKENASIKGQTSRELMMLKQEAHRRKKM